MKIFHLLFMSLILIGSVQATENEMSEPSRDVYAVIDKAKKGIAQCLNVAPTSFGSAGSPETGGFTSVHVGFKRNQKSFSEDEGRRLVICAANMLLQTINSEKKIQPVLTPSPFEMKNISITFINQTPSEKKLGKIPYLEAVSFEDGQIEYLYIIRRGEGYHSVVTETYEEALAILEKEKTDCTFAD